jgi:transposase
VTRWLGQRSHPCHHQLVEQLNGQAFAPLRVGRIADGFPAQHRRMLCQRSIIMQLMKNKILNQLRRAARARTPRNRLMRGAYAPELLSRYHALKYTAESMLHHSLEFSS